MGKVLLRHELVGLDGGVDVLAVDADRDAHDHVLRPFRNFPVAAHEVGSF